jgi:hypothetical protein
VLRLLSAAVLALALLAPAASAQRALVSTVANSRAALSAPQAERLAGLEARATTDVVEIVRAHPEALRTGEPVQVGLPGGAEALLAVDRVETRAADDLSWIGSGLAGATGSFVVRKGEITGTIRAADGLYRIRPLGDGLHALLRVDERAFPQDHPDGYESLDLHGHAEDAGTHAQRSGAASLAAPTVGVVVAYTPSARAEAGGSAAIEALAQLAIDETNTAYANSGVLVRLALVHVYETTQDDQASYSASLTALQNTSDGIFDEVHALRSTHGGDLAVLLTKTSGSCGVGYVNASAAYAFSLSAWDCATGNYTVGHEIGHNFGLLHNTEEDPSLAPFAYGHGLLSVAGDWRTVMAYNNVACSGGFCPRLQRFSTPAISLGGIPTGDEELRNAARVLDRRANTVASFRGGSVASQVALTGTPVAFEINGGQTATTSLTLGNDGAGTLVWDLSTTQASGASGATAYAVATSNDPGGPAVAFENIAATGTALAFTRFSCGNTGFGGDDNGWATVAVPFSFSYFGDAVAQVRVSPNGVLTTGTYDDCAALPEPLPSASAPNGIIAPYWTDQLVGFGGGVVYAEARGDAGAGTARLIVQWNGIYRFGFSTGELNTYQVVLHQNGTIDFQYAAMQGASNDFTGVGVGLESGDGTAGMLLDYLGGTFVQDNLAVRLTPVRSWLAIDGPLYGVAENGTPGSVNVAVDATGLDAGVYTGTVALATNDPAVPYLAVPVSLTVLASATASGGAGWRLLAAPASGVTVDDLAALNLVQGVPGFYPPPQAQPNLYTAYDGAAYTASSGTGEALALGRGFWWYLYDQDLTPGGPSNSTALPMMLTTDGTPTASDVSVPLHGNGWNMLGNPFGTSLDVSGVAGWTGAGSLNSVVVQAWDAAEGTYRTSVTNPVFASWQGFFAEDAAAGTLTIPASARTAGGTLMRSAEPSPMLAFELAAADGPQRDVAAVLRLHADASDGRDVYDASKLEPASSSFVSLGFGGAEGLRAVESRSPEASSFVVPLHVASVGAGPDMELTWPQMQGLPAGWTFTLRDLVTGTRVDLRTQSRYAFTVTPTSSAAAGLPLPGPRALRVGDAPRFELVVETGRVVAEEGGEAAALALDAPRPNPVRGSARIAYTLPEAGPVRLAAYDVQGRQVALLAGGEAAAGRHEAAWAADGLAAGVYVIRLEAAGQVLTHRAVVVR